MNAVRPHRYEDSTQFSSSASYDGSSTASSSASDPEAGRQTEVDQHQAAAARRPVVYQASSPDEVALVTWTEQVGKGRMKKCGRAYFSDLDREAI